MHVLLFIRPLELFHFAWIKFYIPDSPWPPLLLLLLSHFSRVRLCATPETAAHQTPQSLGFSRQELWSGLPFPSPMHESEKWKWGGSVVSDSSWPHGLKPTRLLCPWDFPGKSTGVGCHCLLRWPPQPPGIPIYFLFLFLKIFFDSYFHFIYLAAPGSLAAACGI